MVQTGHFWHHQLPPTGGVISHQFYQDILDLSFTLLLLLTKFKCDKLSEPLIHIKHL